MFFVSVTKIKSLVSTFPAGAYHAPRRDNLLANCGVSQHSYIMLAFTLSDFQ